MSIIQTTDASVPLASNAGWNDVAPVPQDDGPSPVVPIAYAADFRETMDYFRAVQLSNEHSLRTLALTERVISFNAANYTAWHFRRAVLETLNMALDDELAFTEELCKQSPKNYQIWYHRRVLVERMGHADGEKRFTEEILAADSKNYHAWAHRQWCVRRFGAFAGETAFTEALLQADVRNNSAWNHRWFVLLESSGGEVSRETWGQEAAFAMARADEALHNECPYNYVRGVARRSGLTLAGFPFVGAWAHKRAREQAVVVVPLSALLVDVLEAAQRNREAAELCGVLAEADAVRARYWERRASLL